MTKVWVRFLRISHSSLHLNVNLAVFFLASGQSTKLKFYIHEFTLHSAYWPQHKRQVQISEGIRSCTVSLSRLGKQALWTAHSAHPLAHHTVHLTFTLTETPPPQIWQVNREIAQHLFETPLIQKTHLFTFQKPIHVDFSNKFEFLIFEFPCHHLTLNEDVGCWNWLIAKVEILETIAQCRHLVTNFPSPETPFFRFKTLKLIATGSVAVSRKKI